MTYDNEYRDKRKATCGRTSNVRRTRSLNQFRFDPDTAIAPGRASRDLCHSQNIVTAFSRGSSRAKLTSLRGLHRRALRTLYAADSRGALRLERGSRRWRRTWRRDPLLAHGAAGRSARKILTTV